MTVYSPKGSNTGEAVAVFPGGATQPDATDVLAPGGGRSDGSGRDSLVYYAALRKAGVPAEMHVYVTGGHAFGLRRTESSITGWPQLVETWLRTIGMISR